jgi:hypothetical protein
MFFESTPQTVSWILPSCHSHGGDGVSAVQAEAGNSSPALSFLSSLPCGIHFLDTVKYEVLKNTAFALLILVCGVFFEQYRTV